MFEHNKKSECLSLVMFKMLIFALKLLSEKMLRHWFKDMVERHAFGVCQQLGERMRIPPGEVRKYFIYTSFIGLGSPLMLYRVFAFWFNLRRSLRRGRSVLYE